MNNRVYFSWRRPSTNHGAPGNPSAAQHERTRAPPSLRTVVLGLLASDEHGELVPGADDGGQGEGRVGHAAHRVKLQLLCLGALVDEAGQLQKTKNNGWFWVPFFFFTSSSLYCVFSVSLCTQEIGDGKETCTESQGSPVRGIFYQNRTQFRLNWRLSL